jgi:zinc/manganese transport system substrate-binding protein
MEPIMRTLLTMTLLLALAPQPGGAADHLKVVATTADLGAIAATVGGDDAEVTSVARPTEDPHFVDAKPSFIRLLNQADVLIEGGAALEAGWLPPLLDSARNPRIAVGAPGRIVASEAVDLKDVPSRLDRSLGDVHPYGNPHYLLDPVNGRLVAGAIARGLCAVDGAHCETYTANAARFTAALDAKLPEWQQALAAARGQKIVSYHKNFDYLAERFGLEVVGNLEPKPGIPPSPTHLAELVPRMQTAKVRAILIEPYRERQTPDFVATKTGAQIVVLPIMPEGRDYIAFIDQDVRALAKALAPS